MDLIALLLAGLALAQALLALAKSSQARDAADDASRDARRHAGSVEENLRSEVTILRGLLARLVGGETVTSEMVREGLLWQEVNATAAKALLDAGEVALLDVRTPAETSAGIIPGAQLLPMDQIEQRRGEIRTGRPMLVYCAGGGRSAEVCEYLSSQGHEGLINLEGGIGAWEGPLDRPSRA